MGCEGRDWDSGSGTRELGVPGFGRSEPGSKQLEANCS